MSKPSDFAVMLRINPLFRDLGGPSIDAIAALCTTKMLAVNEVLFQKGDQGDALFGIRRGQIRIETGNQTGERLTLNILGPGDLFGEIALLDGQTRTADATAVEPSELYVLRRTSFLDYLKSEPAIALKIIELLCQRIRWISDRMEEAFLAPLHVRLARRICLLAEDFGSELRISQEQMGIYVGAARESVNRQLQIWRKQDILDLGRGRITVKDMERLAAEANRVDGEQ